MPREDRKIRRRQLLTKTIEAPENYLKTFIKVNEGTRISSRCQDLAYRAGAVVKKEKIKNSEIKETWRKEKQRRDKGGTCANVKRRAETSEQDNPRGTEVKIQLPFNNKITMKNTKTLAWYRWKPEPGKRNSGGKSNVANRDRPVEREDRVQGTADAQTCSRQ